MLSPEQKLIRAAMSFGAWRLKASLSLKIEDRVKFIKAETALLEQAQTFYEAQKGSHGGKNRRNKG